MERPPFPSTDEALTALGASWCADPHWFKQWPHAIIGVVRNRPRFARARHDNVYRDIIEMARTWWVQVQLPHIADVLAVLGTSHPALEPAYTAVCDNRTGVLPLALGYGVGLPRGGADKRARFLEAEWTLKNVIDAVVALRVHP